MVGGQTRMPMIVDAVKNLFGKRAEQKREPTMRVVIPRCRSGLSAPGDV